MREYRVGLVGWGMGGRLFHAPFIMNTPGLKLAAVVTSRPQTVDIDVAVVGSLDELLDDESIELVVLATPNHLHADGVTAALDAGKHVVVDKPMVLSVEEALTLVEQAKLAGRKLIPYQNRRWDGDFLTVKQVKESGILGQVYNFSSAWASYKPSVKIRAPWKAEPESGGVIYDLGPHLIDQAINLFGRPKSVYAQVGIRHPARKVIDHFEIILRFADGVQARLEVDQMNPFFGPRFQLRGEYGVFEKFGMDIQEEQLVAGMTPANPEFGVEPEARWGSLRTAKDIQIDARIKTAQGDYTRFYSGVYHAMAQNHRSPVDLMDVVLQLQIIEAAQESARTNTVQMIE